MGTSFQHRGLRAIDTLNSLNWCGVSRVTLVKGKRGRNYPLFLIQLCQTSPKPHADWNAQCAKTQPKGLCPCCAWGRPELLAGFPEAAVPLEGCLQPSFHWFLNRQTTTSHFWPVANYTQHQTVIAVKTVSEGCSPWPRESIWKPPIWKDATQCQCAARSKWADQKSSGWTIFHRKIPIWWKANGFPPDP